MPRFVLLVLLVSCLSACSEGETPGRGGFERPPTLVETTPVTVRPLVRQLEAIGTARANESVTITAKVTDTVRRVRFEDGQSVVEGDVLIEMTNEEEAALLEEAQANVLDARTQYDRLADLLEQRSVPESQVDEARARLQAAVARQSSIEARLKDRLVKAPFAGVLGFRQVSEGTLLTATTPITTLDDISIIKLDFSVPEVHLGKVEVGQEVLAHSSAHPERAFPAEVQTIGSRVDPITRAATIRAHVPNPDGLLRPGMLLRVSLVINREEVPMVPETALRQRGGEVFVFLVEEGFTRMTPVRIGVRQAGWVHVLEGVELGESVISDGVIKVRDNVPVRIIDGEPAAHAAAGAR